MKGFTWRDRARPIIASVIEEVGTDDIKALRKALREAYPFGPRKYWPYKVWLSEIARQLGDKPNLREIYKSDQQKRVRKEIEAMKNAGQLELDL